jgi:hypothetical protein
VKFQFIGLIRATGHDGIVGTDHGAHGTTDASVCRICFLADAVIALKSRGHLLRDIRRGLYKAFAKYPQLNGIHRANRRTFAAKGTFF